MSSDWAIRELYVLLVLCKKNFSRVKKLLTTAQYQARIIGSNLCNAWIQQVSERSECQAPMNVILFIGFVGALFLSWL